MSCSSFSDYFNAKPVFFNISDFDLGVSCLPCENPSDFIEYHTMIIRIIAIIAIILFIIYIFVLKRSHISHLDDSIFKYFNDDFVDRKEEKKQNEELQQIPLLERGEIRENPRPQAKKRQKNIYICDFQTYCCERLIPSCFRGKLWKYIYDDSDDFNLTIKNMSFFTKFLFKYRKKLSFYLVIYGFMLFRPLEYILSIFLANECIEYNSYYRIGFVIVDTILSFCYTMSIYFLMAFLTVRKEMQEIPKDHHEQRAEILNFSFMKGFYFGVIIMIVKILLIANTGRFFSEIGRSTDWALYSLIRQMIFLSLLLRSVLFKKKAIKNNSYYLRKESNLIQTRNYIQKNPIGLFTINKIDKKNTNEQLFKQNLSDKLDKEIDLKIKTIEKIYEINELKGNFKVVLMKKDSSSYPKYTSFMIVLDCCIVAVAAIMILFSYKIPQSYICSYEGAIDSLYYIMMLLEQFVSPLLLFKTVKIENFFSKEEEKKTITS